MKAVLVFCEGRHDIVFTQRSLGAHGGCTWVDKPIRELPSPFGSSRTSTKGLIATRFEQQALEDLPLQWAAQPRPPCFESVVANTASDTIYFLVRIHGPGETDAIVSLLRDLDVTITEEVAGTYEVSEYAAAFLFDADTEGLMERLTAFRRRYGAHFGDLSNIEHGKWVSETTVPVGCFVFHRSAQEQTGTLEDHLEPMVESAWPDRYAKAGNFIGENMDANDKVSSKYSERLKAIITVTGQFNHPGDPMSNIIGRGGLPQERFEKSPLSQALVDFLKGTPWNGAEPGVTAVARTAESE